MMRPVRSHREQHRAGSFRRTALLAALGLLVLVPSLLLDGGRSVPDGRHDAVLASAVMILGCFGAARLLWRGATRTQLVIVALVAVTARVALAVQAPLVSDDVYRFVWDGRVQAAGIDPYRYAPTDPALARLRDAGVWPRINRPTMRTLYPPTNEVAFAAATQLGLRDERSIKVLWLALEALAIGLLVVLLRRTALPTSRVVLYAWHPLPLIELAWSAHPDALVLVPVLVALLAWDRGQRARLGVAIAVATLAKFIPVLLVAPLRERLGRRGMLAAALAAGALYAPYLTAGTDVLGSFDNYAAARYGAGPFAWLTAAGVPDGIARGLLLLALAVGAAAIAARPPTDLRAAARASALLLGGALLASHNVRPWYVLWCLPLLCVAPWRGLLWASATVPLLYVTALHGRWIDPLVASVVVWGPTLVLLALELRGDLRMRRVSQA
jgi:alpha-1,6-mannosyltransferase